MEMHTIHTSLNRDEAARRLGISLRQLDALRAEGNGPKYYQVRDAANSPIRYPEVELARWEAERVEATMARHQMEWAS